MNRKPHILEAKKITEPCNPKRSSKFVRGYGVLHSMLRKLISLLISYISLHNHINFFCHSAPRITSESGGLGGNAVLLI